MPITELSHGYKKPSNPTSGDLFFPALEEAIQKMNDHKHSGTDGEFIASTVQDVLAANWGADIGGGNYRQLLTVPTGMQFDTCRIEVRRSTGEMAYPTIVRA